MTDIPIPSEYDDDQATAYVVFLEALLEAAKPMHTGKSEQVLAAYLVGDNKPLESWMRDKQDLDFTDGGAVVLWRIMKPNSQNDQFRFLQLVVDNHDAVSPAARRNIADFMLSQIEFMVSYYKYYLMWLHANKES